MSDNAEKSWKDRVPPDGHMPPSYEVQVCDEGNKVIAVQMLNKAQLPYKIAVRQGQFYISTDDMETFTKVKSVLNQTIDGTKEAAHTGVPVEVTPVGSNVTPPTPVTEASNVALNFKPKNKFMSYIDGSVDEQVLKALAPVMNKVRFSSNQVDAAKEMMSNNSVTPGHFLWCLDSVLLFLDDAKDLIKQLKTQTKEQYTKKELSEAQLNELKLPTKWKRWVYGTMYETSPEDVIKRVKDMSDAEVVALHLAYTQEDNSNIKRGTPRDIQVRALKKEYEKRKLAFPEIDSTLLKSEPPKVTVTEATFSRKHRREVDCLEIMKNSSFIKKLNLKDGELQTMRDELEGAWDVGYETGWDDNA